MSTLAGRQTVKAAVSRTEEHRGRPKLKFGEDDIDFDLLDASRFEELCFDLLARLGLQDLVWRRDGPDSGRDIECKYVAAVPLVGMVAERWFVECKNHSRGVPPEELASKCAWAEAERPDRLVIVVSSHLTNGARQWLEKRLLTMPCRVHVVEGKALRSVVLGYQDILDRFFADRFARLLQHTYESWLLHDLMPSKETRLHLAASLPLARLTEGELGFLWLLLKSIDWDDSDEENEWDTAVSAVTQQLIERATSTQVSVLSPYSKVRGRGWARLGFDTIPALAHSPDSSPPASASEGVATEEGPETRALFAELLMSRDGRTCAGLYGCETFPTGGGLEVLVSGFARPEATARRVPWPAESIRSAEARIWGKEDGLGGEPLPKAG